MDSFDSNMFSQSTIPQESQRGIEYAGIFRRFIAMFIDNIITSIIINIIAFFATFGFGILAPEQAQVLQQIQSNPDASSMTLEQMAPALDFLIILLIVEIIFMWLYFAGFESSGMQGTPGKRAMGMKVTDTDGDPIGFGMATGRFLGKIISGLLFGIGYLFALFTGKKQALHDMIAGTIVINR